MIAAPLTFFYFCPLVPGGDLEFLEERQVRIAPVDDGGAQSHGLPRVLVIVFHGLILPYFRNLCQPDIGGFFSLSVVYPAQIWGYIFGHVFLA
jgi:hypothetical protein